MDDSVLRILHRKEALPINSLIAETLVSLCVSFSESRDLWPASSVSLNWRVLWSWKMQKQYM